MPARIRLRSIAIVITIAFLVSISATLSQAQTRSRLNAPKELLDVLDTEDRDCVVTNGGLSKSVHVQAIQLAADHSRQLLVRGSGLCLCGAQNCGFWIYRKIGNRYELLLKGAGSTKVSAGQTSARGYRDVISESHASANETILRTYRYDGSQYQLQSCVNRAYYDDNGKSIKTPIERPCEGENKSIPNVILPSSILDQELTTVDHRHLKLSDYSERTIVLNFFASWCGPCRMNLSDLIDLNQNYKTHPIEVLGLVSKKNDADIEEVRKFVHDQEINFTVIWDTEDFAELLVKLGSDRQVLPQTFVIDKAGSIRRNLLGYNRYLSPKFLREILDQIGSDPNKP